MGTEDGCRTSDCNGNAWQQQKARLRAGLLAAAVTGATLLAAACGGGWPATASPATSSGHLYWTNGNWIGRARLNGTGVSQRFITGAAGAGMVAVSSGYLYWANTGYLGAHDGSGAIGRARLNGTDVSQRFITTAQPEGPDAVVVGYGHIYWANDYNIGRANLNGTDVDQRFISVPNGPRGVAGLGVSSRYIYWTNWGNGTIGRSRLNGTGVGGRVRRIRTCSPGPSSCRADSSRPRGMDRGRPR
jgi:hypothetical protein